MTISMVSRKKNNIMFLIYLIDTKNLEVYQRKTSRFETTADSLASVVTSLKETHLVSSGC